MRIRVPENSVSVRVGMGPAPYHEMLSLSAATKASPAGEKERPPPRRQSCGDGSEKHPRGSSLWLCASDPQAVGNLRGLGASVLNQHKGEWGSLDKTLAPVQTRGYPRESTADRGARGFRRRCRTRRGRRKRRSQGRGRLPSSPEAVGGRKAAREPFFQRRRSNGKDDSSAGTGR